MTDYRDQNPYFDEDRRPAGFASDARAKNALWGWVAAAVFLVMVLAVAFGIGHHPSQSGTSTAMNTTAQPPAMTRMTPPATTLGTPASPITPLPNTPVHPGTNQ